MAITPFPRDKLKTPADWQSIYIDNYKREILRVLPWIMLMPAALLGAVAFYFASFWQEASVGQVAKLLLVYVVLVAGLWMLLAPSRPRRIEGAVTRHVLDAARKQD